MPLLDPTVTLSSRQEAFCRHFTASGNAADAARRAGYAEGSARQTGCALLERPYIVERVRRIRMSWQRTARDDEWMPDGWGLLAFMAAVTVVGAAANLRLHLWFTSRVYPAQLAEQRRRSSSWKRLTDTAFTALLLTTAMVIAPEHNGWAAFLIALAISGILSARVMEPATTRAAFPRD